MANEAALSRCLYIIGAQGTGKTTLVNALEEAFYQGGTALPITEVASRPVIIRKVARTVLHDKHFSREDITASPS